MKLRLPGQSQNMYVDFIRHLKKKKVSAKNNSFNDPGVSLRFFSGQKISTITLIYLPNQEHFKDRKDTPSLLHMLFTVETFRNLTIPPQSSLTLASPLLPICPSLRKEGPFPVWGRDPSLSTKAVSAIHPSSFQCCWFSRALPYLQLFCHWFCLSASQLDTSSPRILFKMNCLVNAKRTRGSTFLGGKKTLYFNHFLCPPLLQHSALHITATWSMFVKFN